MGGVSGQGKQKEREEGGEVGEQVGSQPRNTHSARRGQPLGGHAFASPSGCFMHSWAPRKTSGEHADHRCIAAGESLQRAARRKLDTIPWLLPATRSAISLPPSARTRRDLVVLLTAVGYPNGGDERPRPYSPPLRIQQTLNLVVGQRCQFHLIIVPVRTATAVEPVSSSSTLHYQSTGITRTLEASDRTGEPVWP